MYKETPFCISFVLSTFIFHQTPNYIPIIHPLAFNPSSKDFLYPENSKSLQVSFWTVQIIVHIVPKALCLIISTITPSNKGRTSNFDIPMYNPKRALQACLDIVCSQSLD